MTKNFSAIRRMNNRRGTAAASKQTMPTDVAALDDQLRRPATTTAIAARFPPTQNGEKLFHSASEHQKDVDWAPNLSTIFKILVSLRMSAAIWSPIADCDEVYNYWEPLHLFLYGSGFQTWEYSPVYAIRSYAYVFLHALPALPFQALLPHTKVTTFFFVRCFLGLCEALSELYLYRCVCRRLGNAVGRLLIVTTTFATGMFVAGCAFLPSAFSMTANTLALAAWLDGKWYVLCAAGLCEALSELYLYRCLCRRLGNAVGRRLIVTTTFATGMFVAGCAFLPSAFSMTANTLALAAWLDGKWYVLCAAGLCEALSELYLYRCVCRRLGNAVGRLLIVTTTFATGMFVAGCAFLPSAFSMTANTLALAAWLDGKWYVLCAAGLCEALSELYLYRCVCRRLGNAVGRLLIVTTTFATGMFVAGCAFLPSAFSMTANTLALAAWLDGKWYVLCAAGLCEALSELYLYRCLCRRLGNAVGRLLIVTTTFATGMFVAGCAFLPSAFSMTANTLAAWLDGKWYVLCAAGLCEALSELYLYRCVCRRLGNAVGRLLIVTTTFATGMFVAGCAFLPSAFSMTANTLALAAWLDGKWYVLCAAGLCEALSELYLYRCVCRRLGNAVGRLLIVTTTFATGMFVAGCAFLPSAFSMTANTLALAAWLDGKWYLSVLCTAVSGLVGWPFAAVLGLPVVADTVFNLRWRERLARFFGLALFVGGALCGALLRFDSYYYGVSVLAPLNIITYNVFTKHGPSLYGTEPASYYVTNLALNWNLVLPLAVLAVPATLAAVLAVHGRARLWGVVTPVLYIQASMWLWLAIFFAQPHKEERFLFPVYPLLALSAALTLDSVYRLLLSVRRLRRLADRWLTVQAVLVAVFVLVSISRSAALYRNYHAPLDSYMALNERLVQKSKQNELASRVTVCVGKEWYRFPGSFFLPDGLLNGSVVRMEFVRSEFRGLLPKHFDGALGWPDVTRHVPSHMNDMNREEPSRYVSLDACDYLVDLETPDTTELERNFALLTDAWRTVDEQRFLLARHSHRLARAFFLPLLTDTHCTYGRYVVLERRRREEGEREKKEKDGDRRRMGQREEADNG